MDTQAHMLAEVKNEALLHTLADPLPKLKADRLSHTLRDVEAEPLVKTLSRQTLGFTLGDVQVNGLVDTQTKNPMPRDWLSTLTLTISEVMAKKH